MHFVAALELAQEAEVRGDHRGDLGIAAGGLAVRRHNDGQAGGGNLDGTHGYAV